MIKIYFNPSCPELALSVAAIMKSYRQKHLILLIASDPWQMVQYEDEMKKEVFLEAEKINNEVLEIEAQENLIPDNQIYDDLSADDKIILLNIHPLNKEESEYLINFFEKHQGKIKLWVDVYNDWDPHVLRYLKSDETCKFLFDENKSVLQMLKEYGFKISEELFQLSDELRDGTVKTDLAARYIAALSAACITDNNSSTGIKNYFDAFTSVVNEIFTGERNAYLDELVADFLKANKQMPKIKKLATDNHKFFTAAKNIGRPIGYLELKNINPSLDLSELLEYGGEMFPWLFIINYNIDDGPGVLFTSSKIPIFELLERCKAILGDIPSLFPFLEQEVINFKE